MNTTQILLVAWSCSSQKEPHCLQSEAGILYLWELAPDLAFCSLSPSSSARSPLVFLWPLPPLSCLWVLSLEPTWSLTILPRLSLKTHLMVLYPEQPCMTSHVFFLCIYVLPSLLEVGTSDVMRWSYSWGTGMWLAEGKWSTSRPWALQAAECLFATWDQIRDLAFGLETLILHVDPQRSASQLLPGLPVGLGYALCLQRENLQRSFLSGSAGHSDLTWGHSLHSARTPLPHFLKYCEQPGGPSSESGDLRPFGHQVLLPGGGRGCAHRLRSTLAWALRWMATRVL